MHLEVEAFLRELPPDDPWMEAAVILASIPDPDQEVDNLRGTGSGRLVLFVFALPLKPTEKFTNGGYTFNL